MLIQKLRCSRMFFVAILLIVLNCLIMMTLISSMFNFLCNIESRQKHRCDAKFDYISYCYYKPESSWWFVIILWRKNYRMNFNETYTTSKLKKMRVIYKNTSGIARVVFGLSHFVFLYGNVCLPLAWQNFQGKLFL